MAPVPAKTFYKARGMGASPPCAICMGPGRSPRAAVHLPFGVRVWLCADHSSDEFARRRAGRDLAVSLMSVWEAAGCLTRARHRALDAHLARISRLASGRELPGSYAWPALRREAEARFARGESVGVVARELRARHDPDPATAPSRRTMQRWHSERRWLDGGAPPVRKGSPTPSGGSADDEDSVPTVDVQTRTDPSHGGEHGPDATRRES